MPADRRVLPLGLALAAALVCDAPRPGSSQTAAPPGQNVLRDRIVAVVDEDPILASDLERVIALGMAQRRPGEGDAAFRRRVLDEMIKDRLRLHEIDRFGFEQVPVEEIEKRVADIRASFPDEEAFRRTLREVGLTLEGLRQLVARQLVVLTYVEERLGPRVFIDNRDIANYHANVLAPEMRRRNQPVPPIEEVRDSIREVLRQQRLNQEIERWTAELREEADVSISFEAPEKPLPPVVKRIEKKPS
jgi:hypothetical protein